jgi:hypothetical protein
MLSREGLLARRGLFAPAWLPGGLKVLRSLSVRLLAAFEVAAPAAETLWEGSTSVGRTFVSVSALRRLGLEVRADIAHSQGVEAVVRFRLSEGDCASEGEEGGESAVGWDESDGGGDGSDRRWTQSCTREDFATAIDGDNGGVVAIAKLLLLLTEAMFGVDG